MTNETGTQTAEQQLEDAIDAETAAEGDLAGAISDVAADLERVAGDLASLKANASGTSDTDAAFSSMIERVNANTDALHTFADQLRTARTTADQSDPEPTP